MFIYFNYCAESGIFLLDALIDGLNQFAVLQREIVGRRHIENQVCVGGACHNSEIVHGKSGTDFFQIAQHQRFQPIGFLIVDTHGIHVDHGVTVQSVPQLMLNSVDHVVESQDVSVCGNFCMEGDQDSSGAIVVDDQIVDPKHILVGHDDFINLPHKFFVRSLAQQGTDSILGGVEAGPADKKSHQHAAPAVNVRPVK